MTRLLLTQDPQRRRIRLPAKGYAELGMIGSIPSAVTGRAPVFAWPAVAAAAIDVLRRPAAATGGLSGWGVMPDHVHLILGSSPTCDLVTVVGQFKDLAQREGWRRGIKGTFWQTGLWAHLLRGDEHSRRSSRTS